jgi:hypothetical protein
MVNLGEPTLQERLQIMADNLHRAYSDTPLTKSDAFAEQVRLLYALASPDEKKSLPTVKQMCAGIKPEHDVEFIVVCPACGQMFDCRNTRQVEHHSTTHRAPRLN